MGKLLLSLSVTSLIFLGLGTMKNSGDSMFWLASGSQLFQIVRSILVVFLLVQLFTNPPRHPQLRMISGFVAVVVAYWTVNTTYNYQMPALDTLAFMAASVSLLVTALERKIVPRTEKPLFRYRQSLQSYEQLGLEPK